MSFYLFKVKQLYLYYAKGAVDWKVSLKSVEILFLQRTFLPSDVTENSLSLTISSPVKNLYTNLLNFEYSITLNNFSQVSQCFHSQLILKIEQIRLLGGPITLRIPEVVEAPHLTSIGKYILYQH